VVFLHINREQDDDSGEKEIGRDGHSNAILCNSQGDIFNFIRYFLCRLLTHIQSFADVVVTSDGVETAGFLDASDGLVNMFGEHREG
jgi:hypothetical protein